MSARSLRTVSRVWLLQAAAQERSNATDSLLSLIALGQTWRYEDAMRRADVLERAAGISSIADRRHYLRANGIDA